MKNNFLKISLLTLSIFFTLTSCDKEKNKSSNNENESSQTDEGNDEDDIGELLPPIVGMHF